MEYLSGEDSGPPEFQRSEEQRLKARVKARLLGQPELAPRLGRFVLIRLLGQGANGAVYEARDTRDGATVALKLLRTPHAANVARFKQEFRGLSHLVHENLIQLHELFVEGNEWYFTMELVRGVDFLEYVCGREHADFDPEKLRAALIALLEVVQAIHKAGRLHCDLKPSNVLVTETGHVTVLDLGLVTQYGDDVRAQDAGWFDSGTFGTPGYMAPELGALSPPTTASDAYAIGVMLRRALNGARPDASDVLGHPRRDIAVALEEVCAGLSTEDPLRRMSVGTALACLGAPVADDALVATWPVSTTPFVGREPELAALRGAFSRVLGGEPVVVFVHGPSGIGKSALCDRIADELAPQATVLRGRCHERESLPYKAFDGLVDALARHMRARASVVSLANESAAALLQVFPSLRDCGEWPGAQDAIAPANQAELRQRAFSALKSLLRQLAERERLALIVDDVQWADLDSARLLFELLGPPSAPALLYIGAYRSEEVSGSEFLLEAVGPGAAVNWQCRREQLELGSLDATHAQEMAWRLLEGRVNQPEIVATRIAREAAGLPFFVTELALYLSRHLHAAETELTLSDLLVDRVAGLTPDASRALFLLALAARPMAETLLRRAMLDAQALDRELRMLLLSGLVRRGVEGQWVVYHDRLREHVVRLLTTDQAGSLHRSLAVAYEAAADGEPEWLIEHWAGAGEPARALDYAITAAKSAAHKLAFNRAADLYRTALRLGEERDPRTSELYAALGETLVNAGRGAEAAAAFLAAIREDEPDAAIKLRCHAVQHYLRSGRVTEGKALLERLLRDVGIRYPESTPELYLRIGLSRARLGLGRVSFWRAKSSDRLSLERRMQVLQSIFREYSVVDPARALLFQSLFHETALRVGDANAEFMALAWDTYNETFLGGFAVRHRTARSIAALGEMASRLRSPYADGTLTLVRCAAALLEGRHLEVDQLGRDAQAIFRKHCLGTYWEELVCATLRYTALEITGPLTALSDDAPMLMRRAYESSDHFFDATLSRTMSQGLLAQDRPAEAREFASGRLANLDDELDLRLLLVTMNLADVLGYAGEPLHAWQVFDRIWDRYVRSVFDRASYMHFVSHHRRARIAVAVGVKEHDPTFFRIAEHHCEVLEKMRWPDADANAATIRAGVACQRGELTLARELLAGAEAAAWRLGMIVPALCVKRQRGRLSGGADGLRMVEEADDALRKQGIANPARWADVEIPGFFDL